MLGELLWLVMQPPPASRLNPLAAPFVPASGAQPKGSEDTFWTTVRRGCRALLAPRPFKPTVTGNGFEAFAGEVGVPTGTTAPMECDGRVPSAVKRKCKENVKEL